MSFALGSLGSLGGMMSGGLGGLGGMMGGMGKRKKQTSTLIKVLIVILLVLPFTLSYGSTFSSSCQSYFPGSNSNSDNCFGLENSSGFSNGHHDNGLTIDEETGSRKFGSGSFRNTKWS